MNSQINIVDEPYDDVSDEVVSKELSEIELEDSFSWYLSKANKYPLLPKEVINELALKAQAGDIAARNKIINHNQKLVIWIAYKYKNRGMEMMDLIQEGMLGMIHAIDKFEPDKGSFGTYATYWIRQKIMIGLKDKVRIVRIPVNVETELAKLRKIKTELRYELGRDPTDKEVANRSETVKNTSELLKLMEWNTVSLHQEAFGNDHYSKTYQDILEDTNQLIPIKKLIAKEELEQSMLDLEKLTNSVNGLPCSSRDKQIFFAYYGLGDNERAYTDRRLGEIHGVTRQRIWGLVNKMWHLLEKRGAPLNETELYQTLAHITELEILANS